MTHKSWQVRRFLGRCCFAGFCTHSCTMAARPWWFLRKLFNIHRQGEPKTALTIFNEKIAWVDDDDTVQYWWQWSGRCCVLIRWSLWLHCEIKERAHSEPKGPWLLHNVYLQFAALMDPQYISHKWRSLWLTCKPGKMCLIWSLFYFWTNAKLHDCPVLSSFFNPAICLCPAKQNV